MRLVLFMAFVFGFVVSYVGVAMLLEIIQRLAFWWYVLVFSYLGLIVIFMLHIDSVSGLVSLTGIIIGLPVLVGATIYYALKC